MRNSLVWRVWDLYRWNGKAGSRLVDLRVELVERNRFGLAWLVWNLYCWNRFVLLIWDTNGRTELVRLSLAGLGLVLLK